MSTIGFFYMLAGLAYDLFYPVARIAQMTLSSLSSFTYTNPYTNVERTVHIIGGDLVGNIVDIIGFGDITVIESLVVAFVFCVISIIAVNIVKLFIKMDS